MNEYQESDALNGDRPEDLRDYASHGTLQEAPPHDHDASDVHAKRFYNIGSLCVHVIHGAECGPERARRRWITVEIIVLLVAASFGGLSTLSGQYIRRRVSADLYGNATNHMNVSKCLLGNATKDIEDEIQKATSQWILYLNTAGALPSIFSTLFIGTMSERYGRRLPLLMPCIGFLGQCIVQLIVTYNNYPLDLLLIGSVFSGLCGSLALFMAGCFAYVTDITTEKQRMVRIVVIEILIFAGIGAMQIGLGYMIKYLGFARSLWIPFAAVMMSAINAGVPWFLIETVTPKIKEEQGKLKEVFRDIIRLFRVKTDKPHRLFVLLTMIIISIFVGIVVQGGIGITTLYGQGQPFCWESVTIGFFVTISLVIPGIGTVAGAGIFQWCKLSYMWIIQISILSCLANTLVLAFTFAIPSTPLIFGSTFLGMFKLLGLPVIRTYLSTIVEKHEHGALFASLGVLDGICMFLAAPLVNGLYYSTIDILSTMVFFIMSALLIIPIIITGVLQCKGIGKGHELRPQSINRDDDETLLLSSDEDSTG